MIALPSNQWYAFAGWMFWDNGTTKGKKDCAKRKLDKTVIVYNLGNKI